METFNLSFPIDMIKKEERIVSGIATADNIDKAGDIVDFGASIEAFGGWGGNIREMHAPIAVGKAVKVMPIQIDGGDGITYNAFRVDAYISKGAESTWLKVLDGTLRAFSIGGRIMVKEKMAGKFYNGRQVSVIKQYELGELSLVDNPANALATVDLVKMDQDGNLDYVLPFAVDEDEINKIDNLNISYEQLRNVLQNDVQYDMVNPMDNLENEKKVSLVKKFISWLAIESADTTGLLKSENDTEVSKEAEVNKEQLEEEQMDIEVLKSVLGSVIDEKLTAFATSLKEEVAADVTAKIEEVTKGFENERAETAQKIEATEQVVQEQSAKIEQFAQAGAMKKSVDPEDTDDEVVITKSEPESFWKNIYLPQGLINSLGYRS